MRRSTRAEGLSQRKQLLRHSPSQSTVSRGGRGVPLVVHEILRSPGQPLDASARDFFEPRFGHDFSRVRLHGDERAAASARSVNARAYTVGHDVVLDARRFPPMTLPGQRLLAHELAHVVQQDAATPRFPVVTGEPGGLAEIEAEQSASQVLGGRHTRPLTRMPAVLQQRTIFEEIAGLFRGDDFPEDQLLAYLQVLDRTGAIEDYTDSDNKARAVVRRWKRGDSKFLLTAARKILLIKEMLSGFTGDDDERAILDLLRGSGRAEFTHVLSSVGESSLHRAFQGEEQDQLDSLLATRRRDPVRSAERERAEASEVLAPDLVLDLQRRFTSNAESTNRLNCILIVRDIAPRLFASDPALAERVGSRLGRLRGRTLTMPDLGRAMADLGLASAYRRIRFNNGNGRDQPTRMETSAWDAIMDMVGGVQGWHIFGLAVFDGYHSVTVLVDNRPDGPRMYWADQWRIDPGDDFHEEEGSVSGFRRYEQTGFDQFLNEYTESRWRTVFGEKGKRYDATLHIWKFRSGLSEGP